MRRRGPMKRKDADHYKTDIDHDLRVIAECLRQNRLTVPCSCCAKRKTEQIVRLYR